MMPTPADVGGIVSALAAVAAIAFGIIQARARGAQQLLTALQDDKEAVAATALRVRDGKLPWFRGPRRDLFRALCLAAIFQRSGRSRALLYSALGRSLEKHDGEVESVIAEISAIISANSSFTDLATADQRIRILRAALGMDGDLRLRVDRNELREPSRSLLDRMRKRNDDFRTFDRLKRKDDFRAFIKNCLDRESSLVAIECNAGNRLLMVVALDFHRIAHGTGKVREEFVLSDVGKLVVTGKYHRHPQVTHYPDAAVVQRLASRLAPLVPRDAEWLAAVPGTYHAFSAQLGQAIAREVETVAEISLPLVELAKLAPDTPMRFKIVDPTSAGVSGQIGVLIDDVYRTGESWKAAAESLLNANAKDVLGLVATCTISPVSEGCGAHDAAVW